MEADVLEEGEINFPGKGFTPSKHLREDLDNEKENTLNYAGNYTNDPKRRKLSESPRMDPSNPNASKYDSYIPTYKSRIEWMHYLQERQKKERFKGMKKDLNNSLERIEEGSPKSGSEIISDEHNSSFNSNAPSSLSHSNFLGENSEEMIIWPAWLDPAGKISASVPPIAEFQAFIEDKKKQKQKEKEVLRAQLGDLLEPKDVTSLKNSKEILCGDGWKRGKDGMRIPNVSWIFLKNSEQPIDPRGSTYFKNTAL